MGKVSRPSPTGHFKCIDQSLTVVGKKSGVPFDQTFHVAHHSFAVQSLNNGVQMTMVTQLLGHSSTEKVYANFIPAKLRDELLKMNLPSL